MEEANRKPPKEFFRLVDAVVRHPRSMRGKETGNTDVSKSPPKGLPEGQENG